MSLLAPSELLLPILVLVLWTLFMETWMIITRLSAMTAAKIQPQDAERTQNLGEQLPKHVQWKADNYNHLMEHPTIFYAAALAMGIAGMGSALNLILAWLYVGLRIIHSIVQVSVNKVMIRFGLFVLSSLALAAMVINGITSLI